MECFVSKFVEKIYFDVDQMCCRGSGNHWSKDPWRKGKFEVGGGDLEFNLEF